MNAGPASVLMSGFVVVSAACAQPLDAVVATELSLGGASYSKFVSALPGSVVQGRVVVRRATGAALAGVTYALWADSLGFSATPAITGITRAAPFNFGTQSLGTFIRAGGLRIDDAGDAGDSVSLGIRGVQRPPQSGQPADPANPGIVLRFQLVVPNEEGLLHIHVPIDQIRNGEVQVYDSLLPPVTTRLVTNIGVDGAWLYVGGNPCIGQSLSTPPSRRVIAGENVTFASMGEFGYLQWYRNGQEMLDGPGVRGTESRSLVLAAVDASDAGDYVLFGMCSHTNAVRLEVFCRSDFNNDGFTDGFDYDAFIACFEGSGCPSGTPIRTADFNGDGFSDGFDYEDFVSAFELGC